MKALVADHQHGSVTFADVADPTPRPADAVVAVEAFSVNRGETFQLEKPAAGWRPGKDVAGRVVACSADGSGPPAGTRVVAHPRHSGWAQRVAVPTNRLTVVPDTLPATTAAALPLAGLTALRLVEQAGPLLGRRLLLTGASGGVGHYVTELAIAAGAQVTAVAASAARGGRLTEFGATVVNAVEAACGPFDIVMESVGGASLPAALSQLRRGGRCLWFGQASRIPARLDFFSLLGERDGVTLQHFHYDRDDETTGRDLATLVRLTTQGRLHPEIGLIEDWALTQQVISELRARTIRGNAVLTVDIGDVA